MEAVNRDGLSRLDAVTTTTYAGSTEMAPVHQSVKAKVFEPYRTIKQKYGSAVFWKVFCLETWFGREIAFRKWSWKRIIISELYRLVMEFLGTLILVFFIAGISMVSELVGQATQTSGYSTLHKAIIGGLVLTALIYYLGAVSGAHLNPAVTFAFAISLHFPIIRAIFYVLFQLAGAIVAAGFLRAIFGNIAFVGSTIPANSTSDGTAVGIEILITAFLVLVVLGTGKRGQLLGASAGIALGFTLAAGLLFAWDITGASMNPARSLGPAFITGQYAALSKVWIYVVGPFIGALVAVVVESVPYFLFRKDMEATLNPAVEVV